ncbi:MAG: hypothetical protein ACFFCQ_15225 [Promethearchaeota archaeon]
MGKKLIIFVISLVILLPIIVISADLAMTATSVTADDIDVGNPVILMNTANTEATVSVLIEFPSVGLLPKGVKINMEMVNRDDQSITKVPEVEANFGESETITVTFEVNAAWTNYLLISNGTGIVVDVTGTAKPTIIGIRLPISIELPKTTANITPG